MSPAAFTKALSSLSLGFQAQAREGLAAFHRQTQKRVSLGGFSGVQWLRICLPMQGARVQSLVRKLESTGRGATESKRCHYRAHAL